MAGPLYGRSAVEAGVKCPTAATQFRSAESLIEA